MTLPISNPPMILDNSGRPLVPVTERPVTRRNVRATLSRDFLDALATDFRIFGPETIVRLRVQDPKAYVQACLAVLPKQIEIAKTPLEDMNDDELAAAWETVTSAIARRAADARVAEDAGGNGAGTGEAGSLPEPRSVHPVDQP